MSEIPNNDNMPEQDIQEQPTGNEQTQDEQATVKQSERDIPADTTQSEGFAKKAEEASAAAEDLDNHTDIQQEAFETAQQFNKPAVSEQPQYAAQQSVNDFDPYKTVGANAYAGYAGNGNTSYNNAGYSQYYYNPVTGQPYYVPNNAKPPKKKMSKGMKAFIAGAIALLVIAVGAVSTLAFIAVQSGENMFSSLMPKINNRDYNSSTPFDDIFGKDKDKNESNSNDDGSGSSSSDDTSSKPNAVNPDGPQIALESQPKDINDSDNYTAQKAFAKASASTVGVVVTASESNSIGGEGSGIVISEDGYIITNSHVINNSKQYKVSVVIDEETYSAEVVGYDSRTDLAVLKINPSKKLTAAEFANSDELSIGQEVAAIGNPGGIKFSNSITKGIVSALNRTVKEGGNVAYIQTDAAINPGNSGGPLINMNGQVVGINTIKIVDTQYEGMGFAIPSVTVKEIVDDIISTGYVSGRCRLGIRGAEVTQYQAQLYGVPQGILIGAFDDDCTLPALGVEEEDIITSIGGVKITSLSQLYSQLEKYEPGDKAELEIYRMADGTGKDKTFTVKAVLLPDNGD